MLMGWGMSWTSSSCSPQAGQQSRLHFRVRNSTIPTNAELVIFTGATDQHFAGIVKLNHLTAAPEEHFLSSLDQ